MAGPALMQTTVTCPHCEGQHLIGLVRDGQRVAVLNPNGDETLTELLSEFMGDRWRARVRNGFGSTGPEAA